VEKTGTPQATSTPSKLDIRTLFMKSSVGLHSIQWNFHILVLYSDFGLIDVCNVLNWRARRACDGGRPSRRIFSWKDLTSFEKAQFPGLFNDLLCFTRKPEEEHEHAAKSPKNLICHDFKAPLSFRERRVIEWIHLSNDE
jgi:hypothetical protein